MIGITLLILFVNPIIKKYPLCITQNEVINGHFTYQLFLLIVAFIVLIVVDVINADNLARFFAFGDITATAEEVKWLGILKGVSWFYVGIIFTIVITGGTLSFMILQSNLYIFKSALLFLPWIILFSLLNSFSEEVIYRLGVIVPLFGHIDTHYIMSISAILFGLPHLRGMPNGIIGAFMAGFLGWILAKSVIETEGIFWAWMIHFIQDVVIFASLIGHQIQSVKRNA